MLAFFLVVLGAGQGAGCSGPGPRPAAPAISIEPYDQTVVSCDDVRFSVRATGTPPMTYEWRKDGKPIGGADEETYLLSAAVPSDAGTYSVVVTNPLGKATSQGASLTVFGSRPDPPGAVILVREGGAGLAVDSTTLVWTGFGLGYVHAARLPCGRPVRSVYERASIYNAPARVLLFGGEAYWADGSSGGIWKGYLDGRPATLLAQTANVVYSLARAGERLYWTDPSGANIQSMALAGGDVTNYSVGAYPTNGPNAIAVDDAYVYWNDVYEQTVKRMPLGGGPTLVLASSQGYLAGVAADGQRVYWASTETNAGVRTGRVRSVGRDGGTAQLLVSREGVQTIGVLFDGGWVYWTADPLDLQVSGQGVVGKVRPDGTEGAIIGDGLTSPYEVAADDTYLYWIEDPSRSGRITRIKK